MTTLKVIINPDGKTCREVNPMGTEPDQDDFDMYPLPICFDDREELRELNRRKDRIEREWQEAEDTLRTFEIDFSRFGESKIQYLPGQERTAEIIEGTNKVRII